jgi:hypothetical protein
VFQQTGFSGGSRYYLEIVSYLSTGKVGVSCK